MKIQERQIIVLKEKARTKIQAMLLHRWRAFVESNFVQEQIPLGWTWAISERRFLATAQKRNMLGACSMASFKEVGYEYMTRKA
jgi:hypothetical protein